MKKQKEAEPNICREDERGFFTMPVMEYLERNARLYPDEVALVELNPEENDTRRMTWKENAQKQPTRIEPYRRENTRSE